MLTINQTVQKLSARNAAVTLLILTAGVLLFHTLIVLQIIPYNIVWGGRLTSYAEMIRFESISISINLIVAAVAAMVAGFIPKLMPQKLLGSVLWALFILLVFNTIANPFSATLFEAIVFTPMTFIMAVCVYRLILNHK